MSPQSAIRSAVHPLLGLLLACALQFGAWPSCARAQDSPAAPAPGNAPNAQPAGGTADSSGGAPAGTATSAPAATGNAPSPSGNAPASGNAVDGSAAVNAPAVSGPGAMGNGPANAPGNVPAAGVRERAPEIPKGDATQVGTGSRPDTITIAPVRPERAEREHRSASSSATEPLAATAGRARKREPAGPHLLTRTPLGFDLVTLSTAQRDFDRWTRTVRHDPSELARPLVKAPIDQWVRLAVLVLFLVCGFTIKRIRPQNWRRFWRAGLRTLGNAAWAGTLLRLLRRMLVPLGALLFWEALAAFAPAVADGYDPIEQLLALWCAGRAVVALLQEIGRRAPHTRERLLTRPAENVVRFAGVWLAGWILLDALGARSDLIALWVATGHLALVLGTFVVLSRRDEILGFLPELESRTFAWFRRVLTAAYRPLLYGSLLIALLWVAGYRNLAELFLGRIWSLLGLCLLGFGLFQAGQRRLQRWIPAGEDTDGRERALNSSGTLLALLLALAIGWETLRALGLFTLWQHVSVIPFLHAGNLRLTLSTLWWAIITPVVLIALSRWLQALLGYRVYPTLGVSRGEAFAWNRLLHYSIIAATVLLVVRILGLPLQSLAIVLGGASVGLGFGLQSIANNLASGLILLTSRQVRQGDVITVGDLTGKVADLSLRATVVTTGDNVDLIIPNSQLLNGTLTNWTHNSPLVRTKIPFEVSYAEDPARVREIALAIAARHPEVVSTPATEVWFKELGENGIRFELLVWVNIEESVRSRVTSDLYFALFDELNAQGIVIPSPQREIHLADPIPWRELIAALAGRSLPETTPPGAPSDSKVR